MFVFLKKIAYGIIGYLSKYSDLYLSSIKSYKQVQNSIRRELLLVDGTEGMAQDTWMDAGVAMMSRFAETLTNVIDPLFWILSILKVLA